MSTQMKLFRLQDLNGKDIFGGEMSLDNAYVSQYGKIVRNSKPPNKLDVDEICYKEYALSGQKPTVYAVVRTQ